MRTLRRIFSRFHLYVMWFFVAFLTVGLLFSRLNDTDEARKVVLYADVPSLRDVELAAALEGEMPEGIRMIQVHPFSYAMFDSDSLLRADLYIIPQTLVEDYADGFRAIPDGLFDAEGGYRRGGELWGLKVWDAASRRGIATDYISYPDEDCWLFFNKDSLHVLSLGGTGDDAAVETARALLNMGGDGT